jgi:diguanylate cyclase (GGDEF)-like protein/PAS domain S-box-containing protein
MAIWGYAIALLIAAIASGIVASISWQRRGYPGSRPLTVMTLALSIWSFTYALFWLRVPPQGYFWLDATYTGVVIVPMALLAFTLQFTGRSAWLTRPRLLASMVWPILTLLILWTDPWHGLFFGQRPEGSGTILSGGFWFYFHIALSYVIILICLVLLLRSYGRSRGIYRLQILSVIFGILIPLGGNVLSLTGGSPLPNLDLTPLLFTISSLIFTYSLYQLGLLDLVPIARDTLIEQMRDGVIVLDAQKRVVDANPAAHRLLGLDGSRIIGRRAEELLATHPELDGLLQTNDAKTETHTGANGQSLDLRSVLLSDRNENFNGRLIMVRDISERVRVEQALRGANRDLENQVAENKELQDQLRELTIRDALTGLFNRRYLEESLARELAQMKRSSETLCVAMLDIDNFKQFNDEHGHPAGDAMLIHLGKILRAHIREGDIVCRYGGEEFAVVLPSASAEIAMARIEECRRIFESTPLSYKGVELRATISAGVSTYPRDGQDTDALLDQADKAMYLAKQRGKNRVMSSEALVG